MTIDVAKLALCLKELGVTKLDFHARKKLCKLAYLLTVFGVDIGLPLDSFRWYLHGINHPEISKLLAEITHQKGKAEP